MAANRHFNVHRPLSFLSQQTRDFSREQGMLALTFIPAQPG
jgi:hypothetical protein